MCSVAILGAVVVVGLACGGGGGGEETPTATWAATPTALVGLVEATATLTREEGIEGLTGLILSIDPKAICNALGGLPADRVMPVFNAANEDGALGLDEFDELDQKAQEELGASILLACARRNPVAGDPTLVFLEAEAERTTRNMVLGMLETNGQRICDLLDNLSAEEIGEWAFGPSTAADLSSEFLWRTGLAFIEECERINP